MPQTVRITFLYAIGSQVRYADDPRPYTILTRTYTERGILGPVVTYRLERHGTTLDTAYEPDLTPWEEP